jgi:hypothetical protein
MTATLRFPTKTLPYPWQAEYHRIRMRCWATRELAGLLREDTRRSVARLRDTRRQSVRLLSRCGE